MQRFNFFFWIIFTTLSCLPVWAQSQASIHFTALKDTESSQRIFELRCAVITNGVKISDYQLCLNTSPDIKLLTPNCFEPSFQSDTLYFPIKFIKLKYVATPEKPLHVTANLQSKTTPTILATAEHQILLQKSDKIVFHLLGSAKTFSKKSPEHSIEVKIRNLSENNKRLVITPIQKNKLVDFTTEEQYLSLPALSDTTLIFPMKLAGKPSYGGQHFQTMTILDLDKKTNKTLNIPFTVLSSKSNRNPIVGKSIGNTYLEARYRSINQFRQSAEVFMHHASSTKNKDLHYQFHAFYYPEEQEALLQNSFYKIRKGPHTIKVGNMYLNRETAFQGRGIFYQAKGKEVSYSLAYLNGHNNILANDWGMKSATGNTWMAAYGWQNEVLGSVESRAYFRTRTQERAGIISLAQSKEFDHAQINTLSSVSLLHTEKVIEQRPSMLGFSSEVKFYYKKNKWQFVSDNRITAPEFAGLYQGQIILNQRATYQHSKNTRFYATGLLLTSNPRLPGIFNPQRAGQKKFKPLWQQRLGKQLELSLSPYYWSQYGNQADFYTDAEIIASVATNGEINLRFYKDSKLILLSSDLGQYQLDGDQFFTQNYRLLLNSRKLGLTVNYRKGSKYLFEQVETLRTGLPREYLSIEPRWHINIKQGKVVAFNSAQIIYDNFRNLWTNSIINQTSWQINSQWMLSGQANYLFSKHFHNLSWSVALRRTWQVRQRQQDQYDLDLQFFHDKNGNGQKDKSEPIVPQLVVNCQQETLLSDDKGELRLQGIPTGYVHFQVQDPTGKLTALIDGVMLNEHTTLAVPMAENIQLNGFIQIANGDSNTFNWNNIELIAQGAEERLYRIKARADGSYQINLPEGRYVLYINTAPFGPKVEVKNNYRYVEIRKGVQEPENFVLTIKERKKKVKKF